MALAVCGIGTVVLGGKFISIKCLHLKKERSLINRLNLHFKKSENNELNIYPEANRTMLFICFQQRSD